MKAFATATHRRGEMLMMRVQALESALDAGRDWLSPAFVERGDRVVQRAGVRLAHSIDHTVVALAGSTGSGKSTIINALAGREISRPGIMRPTTSRPVAAVWDVEDGHHREAGLLLDWLEVGQRIYLEPSGDNRGLVLLDLPDHDSVVVEHRVRAERLLERADLLVWVMDPQKYADAALHERYLRPLAGHAGVVVLVLNQIDRLSPQDQAQCLADLRRLAVADGLTGATVLGLSAVTGQGMGELRELMAQAAAERAAATDRLLADVRGAAALLQAECGPSREHRVGETARRELLDALAAAARTDVVVDAVRGSALHRARAATGWPLTRWVGRLRADPLRRLNLHRKAVRADLARTSLPAVDAAMTARTHTAVRGYVDAASTGAPPGWVVFARAAVRDDGLPDALDQAVARTELDAEHRPWWWAFASVVQWVLFAIFVAGLAWLAVLAILAFIQLPVPGSPDVSGFPIPTLMVVGGFGVGVVLALVSRLAAYVDANRAARRAARRLRTQISVVAGTAVIEPVEARRRQLDECRAAAALAGR
ncbi:50S ribosome-binding GTPase [Sanguibacter gelidistatuariae]|uniref:50S ribosome-binding GTPase n=1 Tax=Sanguibacter gelidistatuariae TaxID=1814289 RepID=A0A1G6N6M6_9MICO|nr:GTPase [Sanguibacter gelidistatuariae]SDC63500.1 50S ribosome-binding GTPase [Sanguibacter gelidistatuariae]